MKYYIGLDNGGTSTKAAVFDTTGRELGVCSVSTATITPRPNYVERDMGEMWRANCTVIRGVLEKADIAPENVAGVGICGHGKGLYLWGKDDKPVRNGIISTDNRAYAYPAKWREEGVEQAAFELSCQHVLACQPVSLLAWMRDNEPESYKNIRWVFACKDYVRFRMTGMPCAELTDYSGTNLVNLYTQSYDDRLLSLFGLEEICRALPPLCRSLDICGGVSESAAAECGLCPGTPVIGGMFDIDACALAAGVTDEKNICMIAGTWSINEYIRRNPVTDGRVLMNSLFCLPGYYLVEESSPTSAGNNEWFIRQLLPETAEQAEKQGRSIYEVMNEWVAGIAPEEYVPVFMPFIMASNVHPNAKGSFIGISANHTRRHLTRSVYEGITFSHRYHLEKLLATRDDKPRRVHLAGGAAHSPVWVQMFADVMHLPVVTVHTDETGALGCAIAAAAATGEYANVAEAAVCMSALSAPVYPNECVGGIYDKKYAMYLRTIECLNDFWSELNELM